MIDPAFFDGIVKILFVCVIVTSAYIITTKNLISLVRVYALQSLTLVIIALGVAWYENEPILLAIAILTLVFKVCLIPYFIATIQEKIRIPPPRSCRSPVRWFRCCAASSSTTTTTSPLPRSPRRP